LTFAPKKRSPTRVGNPDVGVVRATVVFFILVAPPVAVAALAGPMAAMLLIGCVLTLLFVGALATSARHKPAAGHDRLLRHP
jgi:hypothetical protein